MDRNKKIGILALLLTLIAAGLLNCSGGDDSYDPSSDYSYSTNPCLDQRIAAEDSCVATQCSNCAGFACLACWANCSNQSESVYYSCSETGTPPPTSYPYSVSGWVKAEDGTGVQDVTMSLPPASPQLTDMYGYYSFENINSGTLSSSKTGYCFVPENRYYSTATQTTTFTNQNFAALLSCFSISGTITRTDNTPLAEIIVELSGSASASTTTDSNGIYIFTDLYNGSYTVTPTQFGSTPPNRSVSISDTNVTGQDFMLTGRAISGRITTVAGTAVPGVNVTLSGTASSSTTSNSDGYYIFPGLDSSGSYTITLSQDCIAYTFDKPFITVDLLDVDIPVQDFVVSVAPLDISGEITTAYGAFPNVMVTRTGTGATTSTMTDAGGLYNFTGIQDAISSTITPAASNYIFLPAKREVMACKLEGAGQDFSGTKTWVKVFGKFNLASLDVASDGGYIVVGYVSGVGYSGYSVIKLDRNGNVLWQKAYDGAKSDYAQSIRETSDGGYIIAGGSESFGAGSYDYWVLKLNGDGNVLWQKTYGELSSDFAHTIRETTDGGYIVAGYSLVGSTYKPTLLKLDSNGNILWQKRYGGSLPNYSFSTISIQETSDRGYIVATTNTHDYWIMKLNSDGNVLWQKRYSAGIDYTNSIQETPDGGYIVAGHGCCFGAGYYDIWLLKLDSNGNVLWQKTYGGTDLDYANSILVTVDGGYIVAGSTRSFGVSTNFWVLKLDSGGNILWQKTYGSAASHDWANSIQETTDGGYIISGTMMILKIDSEGNLDFCGMVGTSNATVTDTNVSPVDSTATVSDIFATITDTTVVPQDISVTVTQMCPSM